MLKLMSVAAVLAALLFAAMAIGSSDRDTALAATSGISCDFSNAYPGGGSPASVTCTVTVFRVRHTLVVSFIDNNPAGPSRNDVITSCTFDGKPIRNCGLPAS